MRLALLILFLGIAALGKLAQAVSVAYIVTVAATARLYGPSERRGSPALSIHTDD
jgi:hypothetical protein